MREAAASPTHWRVGNASWLWVSRRFWGGLGGQRDGPEHLRAKGPGLGGAWARSGTDPSICGQRGRFGPGRQYSGGSNLTSIGQASTAEPVSEGDGGRRASQIEPGFPKRKALTK